MSSYPSRKTLTLPFHQAFLFKIILINYYGNPTNEVIDMIKKLFFLLSSFLIFFYSIAPCAEDFKYVEIFDPKQDKVVKVVQINLQIQDMISCWIKNVDGLYKNDPATDDGYVVKIPLDPVVKAECAALNTLVSEVYILIPKNDPPCYLIFENENSLLSFPFNGDINKLSKILDFKLTN
jgi:hypothetical protein